MTAKPIATLTSHIQYPKETIYSLWQASRSSLPIPPVAELNTRCKIDKEFAEEVDEIFRTAIASDIPVAENLDFIFLLENVPIALREQIVRHRIGHNFGENFGVDMIPEIATSSWWSQSMRILDMGRFAIEEAYFTPDSLVDDIIVIAEGLNEGDEKIEANPHDVYHEFMRLSGETYQTLIACGMSPEEARLVIPLAATSRLTWKVNYQALKNVMAKRGCWIAQLGMWEGIIHSMVNELCTKIDEVFRVLITPPCIQANKFRGCPFVGDNIERIVGRDPLPPCSLFLHHHSDIVLPIVQAKDSLYFPKSGSGSVTWDTEDGKRREVFKRMQVAYSALWNRDAWLGHSFARS